VKAFVSPTSDGQVTLILDGERVLRDPEHDVRTHVWMTPDEARALSEDLLLAATEADPPTEADLDAGF